MNQPADSMNCPKNLVKLLENANYDVVFNTIVLKLTFSQYQGLVCYLHHYMKDSELENFFTPKLDPPKGFVFMGEIYERFKFLKRISLEKLIEIEKETVLKELYPVPLLSEKVNKKRI